MGQLDGTVAIVTGAGRGIGKAFAKVYAREGARVAVVSRTQSTLDGVVAEIQSEGGEAIGIACDVGVRDTTATRAPSRAYTLAKALPMPLPAPVTMATVPSN